MDFFSSWHFQLSCSDLAEPLKKEVQKLQEMKDRCREAGNFSLSHSQGVTWTLSSMNFTLGLFLLILHFLRDCGGFYFRSYVKQ